MTQNNLQSLFQEYKSLLNESLILKKRDKQQELRAIEIQNRLTDINHLGEKLKSKMSILPGTLPDVGDLNFSGKLIQKQEFNKNRYKVHAPPPSNTRAFSLTNNQVFLKNFISPKTRYKGVLLFHGVGVGKTCSAIQIAEQFKDVYKKKILVLCPKSLVGNFQKELFDINKVPVGVNGLYEFEKVEQCTGTTYVNQINNRMHLNRTNLEQKIKKQILKQYQIIGFWKFVSIMMKIKQSSQRGPGTNEDHKTRYQATIDREFSNRVVIIDEIHNMRAENEETRKFGPKLLFDMIKYSHNLRLILLSATPMFNDTSEILWILNLLLLNDKRPLLDESKIFDRMGFLTQTGKVMIENNVQGYVSYMRGEDPFTFPLKLYPNINNDTRLIDKSTWPKYDIKGERIPKKKRLTSLHLIGSVMGEYQDDWFLANRSSNENSISIMLEASNIVYPGANSVRGFADCFTQVNKGRNVRFQYKPNILQEYGEFLAYDVIDSFASKIRTLIDYISQAQGIVYVYSYFLENGVLPIAMALEHAGMNRHGGQNLLYNVKNIDDKIKGNYVILSGDSRFPRNIQSIVGEVNHPDNVDGNNIKVVLGTSVTTEGIDFKNIREVHVFEPWYHLNKTEQIVGRAVRKNSHILLPQSKRNVTVFLHANMSKSKYESIDLKNYRRAEEKQNAIKEVENILKTNSIDCFLNEKISFYNPDTLGLQYDVITSQNVIVKNYKIGDDPSQQYTCNGTNPLSEGAQIDMSTFDITMYKDDIDKLKPQLEHAFAEKNMYTYEELYGHLSRFDPTLNEDLLKYALHSFILQQTDIQHPIFGKGTITYRDIYYVFIPRNNNVGVSHIPRRLLLTQQVKEIIHVDKDAFILHIDKVYQNINDKLSQLNIDTESLRNKFYNVIIDYVVDRIPETALLSLFTFILAKKVKDFDFNNDMATAVLQSLEQGMLLYRQEGVYAYCFNPYNEQFYEKRNGKLEPISRFDYDMNLRPLIETTLATIQTDALVGFLDATNKASVSFKLKGDNKRTKGIVCAQSLFTVDEIKERITSYDKEINYQSLVKLNKAKCCDILELLYRMNQNSIILRIGVSKLLSVKNKEIELKKQNEAALKKRKPRQTKKEKN